MTPCSCTSYCRGQAGLGEGYQCVQDDPGIHERLMQLPAGKQSLEPSITPQADNQLEFRECDSCRRKPGTPILCNGCLHNRSVIAAKDAEIARLLPLALAVGNHSHDEVPPDVYAAWKEPAKYRDDEIHKLREEVTSKDHEAKCLRREIVRLNSEVVVMNANAVEQAKEIAKLKAECESLSFAFNEGMNHLDRLFQVEPGKPLPLLPGFLRTGESKSKGVVKLAEEYLALKAKIAELEKAQ